VKYIAPVRIDFAGGWTDVEPYASRRGGLVVNAAIALHVSAECRPRRRGIRLASLDLDTAIEADTPDHLRYDGRLDLLKAAVRESGLSGGWEVTTDSAVPPGSGLGASGALGVALVAATGAAAGRRLPREGAAVQACRLEHLIGIAGGSQDQWAAAQGGFLFLEYGGAGGRPEPACSTLGLDPRFVHALERQMVLCYTGTSRISGDTIRRVMTAFEAGVARVAAALDGLREAALAARTALLAADLGRLADAVDLNWRHQQALDPGMATRTMQALEAAARAAGATAAKACGAGAGGCMAFIAPGPAAAAVRQAAAAAGAEILPLRFDSEGVREAAGPGAPPAAGKGRLARA
jgi:D-glycero-alpha-D-manno-heptose-7-phosphate kinase